MTKKSADGDAVADGLVGRAGQDGDQPRAKKKPAAKKPVAKKAAPEKKKPTPAKKASSPPRRKPKDTDQTQLLETINVSLPEEIEDAEVISSITSIPYSAAATPAPIEAVEPALTEEEQQLTAIYGEEITAPATAHAEYQDRQTADEDRPMMPEINARDERKQHWQDRRNQRRQRREVRDTDRQQRQSHPGDRDQGQRQGGGGGGGGGGQQRQGGEHREARPQVNQPRPSITSPAQMSGGPQPAPGATITVTNGHTHDALARVGTPLGDAAATVFAQLRNGQPLPVRQLAQMMRKRNFVEIDPEQLAPQLKAELLGDERSYRTLGLRPRIVYRGRDLFAPGPVAMSVTADAEADFAASLSRLAGATHRALAQRISKASALGFERLIHAYLVAAGYRDIAWVKRLGGISYASATAPGIDRPVLISSRSGDQPIDRRGIGELRVGVEAKNLVAGILFSARELSEDAEKELERAGRSIAVMCGDQLVAALIANGVGVVSSAAPLHYVDDQLLDELLAG